MNASVQKNVVRCLSEEGEVAIETSYAWKAQGLALLPA